VGAIPSGLPDFRVPSVDASAFGKLFTAACAISLIGFMETISIAKAIAGRTRQRIDANQELIGQGLSNIVGSFFQSLPVSGSFARSAVNFRSGARSGFSSVVAGSMVVITLLWLTPYLYFVPLATLAAIIMMSVFSLIQVRPIVRAWKVQRQDGVVAVFTFAMTLAFAPHLDVGIMLGVGLSLLTYLHRTMRPRVAVLSRHPDGTLRDADVHGLKTCQQISVLRFDGSLYFGSAGYFEDKVMEKAAQYGDLQFVIVDAEGINHVDATGEEMLLRVFERLREAGVEVLIAAAKKQIIDALERTGSIGQIGRDRVFRTMELALAHAWLRLGNDHPLDCPLRRPTLSGSVPNYRV
jgi:SulP family sulfate permease